MAEYKRWTFSKFSPNFETLKLTEEERPTVSKPTDVLVEVKAASVNPIDILMAKGYGASMLRMARVADHLKKHESVSFKKFPLTLGHDFCGIVIAKGVKVGDDINVGDRVWGVTPVHDLRGTHATHVVTDAATVSSGCVLVSTIRALTVYVC